MPMLCHRPLAIEPLEHRTLLSATPLDVATALAHSHEHYLKVVSEKYEHYLARSPDAQGLGFWANHMQAGLTEEWLDAELIGSPEYVAGHGGSGSGWVAGLYQDMLGRSPDSDGLAHWSGRLAAGAAPDTIAHGFATSRELESLRVADQYTALLGRTPNPSELAHWLDAYEDGWTNDDIEAAFVGSDEYFQRHGGNHDAFLRACYRDLLDRDPDEEGERHWRSEMDVEFEAELVGTGAAFGHAEFEVERDEDGLQVEFEVEVYGAIGEAPLDVQVDGVLVGQIVVDSRGHGELTFSSDADESEEAPFPAGFPGIRAGSIVEIGALLHGTFTVHLDDDHNEDDHDDDHHDDDDDN